VTAPDPAAAHSILEHGPSLILDARIEIGDFEFHFDALKRSSATDSSGSARYEPVVFHYGDTVPEFQQLLLAFGGYVLHLGQGRYPTTGIVVHGPQCSLRSISLTPKYPKVELIAATLAEIARQGKQIPLLLNKNCTTCEFQSRCLAEAKEQDNLTLLNRMTEKTVQEYARKGIFTVTQLSYTFHPRRQSKRAKARTRPHSFALQALAIREQKIYILAPPLLPPAETRLFIDMEGVPDGSFV
jgi:predicted RecB family nuclease